MASHKIRVNSKHAGFLFIPIITDTSSPKDTPNDSGYTGKV